ncbi:MAG: bicyclomycin resistance protein [Chitinophagaceae bacterium]|nr:bicyclomycin resistance protein [Rubrivivax sp.]
MPVLRAQAAAQEAALAGQRVLKYAFQVAETGFDPAQLVDIYSRTITAHIFEGLFSYDHLARPPRYVPLVAEGLPEVTEQFRVWTLKVRPGIFFTDDPAFKGKKRELVAEDFVYSFKRFADPVNKSPAWATVEENRLIGLAALRKKAVDQKKAFDYDTPVEGLRALDRYTVQFKLEESRPRFMEMLAGTDLFGAVAREVVQLYGDRIAEHPVGTGPFKLGTWRRSSQIVLERNPDYRERLWHAEPAADDAAGQAIAARLKGRRLPLIDRVEISIIEESQPRWLSFLNGQANFLERLPGDFVNVAMPGGTVAPNLAKRGITGQRVLTTDVVMTYFNMEDPVIGGYTPEKVALRRAMSLGVDLDREIRVVRRGMGIPAQSPLIPFTTGYDPKFKSENSDYSPARAKALLDLYGYVDKNGDGWREMPDGSPLVLQAATQPDQVSRQLNELWQKNMNAIGLNIVFKPAKWPENLKAARAGKLQMWGVASSAAGGDGLGILERYYSPSAGQGNLARFNLPAFDRLYEQLNLMPDGPEREALFHRAKRLAVAYAPYKLHCHRFVADMMYAGVAGYRRPAYWLEWWHMVDVEPGAAVPPV